MLASDASARLRKQAIEKMRSPYQMGIICIDITNKCDLACSNCTRLLENQDVFWDMTPENFRMAARSLADYPGMIAIIGGNPPMHRNFVEICKILVEEIPDKSRRGLWTNNVFKHATLAQDTFGGFNLNPHADERGVQSLQQIRKLGIGNYYEGHSFHSPLLTAVKDLFPDEQEMWERISNCDINQEWSATIVQNRGKLRAYFCEVAASFDLARGTDHGIEVTPGWWRRHISEFEDQVAHFCPGCGVPAKLKGNLDVEEIDTYTRSNEDLALKSVRKKKRKVQELKDVSNSERARYKVTQYSEDVRRLIDVDEQTRFLRRQRLIYKIYRSVFRPILPARLRVPLYNLATKLKLV
jgi:hypothetical protein